MAVRVAPNGPPGQKSTVPAPNESVPLIGCGHHFRNSISGKIADGRAGLKSQRTGPARIDGLRPAWHHLAHGVEDPYGITEGDSQIGTPVPIDVTSSEMVGQGELNGG